MTQWFNIPRSSRVLLTRNGDWRLHQQTSGEQQGNPAAHRSLRSTHSLPGTRARETRTSLSHLDCADSPAAAAGANFSVAIGEDAGPDGAGVAVRAAGGGGGAGVERDVLEVIGADHADRVPLRRRLVAGGVRPVRPDVVDAALGVLEDGRHRPDVVGDLVEARQIAVIDEDG